MSDESFSLEQFYSVIEQHLLEHLPGVQVVAFWPDITSGAFPLPAVFLEVSEFEPANDIGTGETSLTCRIEARIIVDPIYADHHRQAVQLATQLAVLLRIQTWGLAVEPAEFVQSTQDWSRPELDGYTIWLVEWTQQVYLGEEEWPWPNEPPGSLLLSISPGAGPSTVGDYEPPEAME